LFRTNAQDQFHKGGVWVAFHVEFGGNLGAQCFHIRIPNVPLVRPGVHGDALGTEFLDASGCLYYVGHVTATSVPQGGDFVDVDGKMGV
jgi:hypothetical protein